MASPGFPYVLGGPWAKLCGYGARLALILHLSRVACGVVELNGEVDEVSMKGAVALVDYFKSHARRVYRLIPVSLQEKRDGQ